MFCGLCGSFGLIVGVLFFDCFNLGIGQLRMLLDLDLLLGLFFSFLFMGFFLHFRLFVLFLHLFSMLLYFFSRLLHLFLMLLLHFFLRRLHLWIRQFFLGVDWSFPAFLSSSSSGWQRMYWFFISWLFYFSFINDRGFRIMDRS